MELIVIIFVSRSPSNGNHHCEPADVHWLLKTFWFRASTWKKTMSQILGVHENESYGIGVKMNLTCFQQDVENVMCNCSISSFKRRIYPATYLLIFTLGLLGNLLSLCVFVSLCRRKTLTTVNLYLVNLLLSDLMLVCSLPFRASYYLMDSHWVFGDLACRLISYTFYINMYSSVYFLVALSVMRYLAVMRPYRYVRLQTSRSTRVVCAVIWLSVSMGSIPLLTVGSTQDVMGRVQCLELGTGQLTTLIQMNHASIFFSFLLPFFVISFCYFFVVRSLLKSREVLGNRKPCYRKSCALVIIVLAIFLVCFLPYHVVRTLFLEAEREVSTKGYGTSCGYIAAVRKMAVVTLCLAAINSCLDPILFFFVGENFREFFCRKYKKEQLVEEHKSKMENRPPRAELQRVRCNGSESPEEISVNGNALSGFHGSENRQLELC
ncbi:hypothetical protein AAFF_G00313160 [Aldrovandia affinis]|uniref:G-protein coupled receptors family 1 profile domain-containing protein n=1 Tax=Aldrovandia affinis TaxID=143900 RepID=A0AAD7SNF1_9TELE|nr:hypothetical protein AAFF_G00313160 [Aldrovandia affinis]